MKKTMKTASLVSALVFGLIAGTAMVQNVSNASASQQKMDGNMMMEKDQDMMHDGMTDNDMMNGGMMGSGMMGNGMMGRGMMGHGMMGGKMMMGQGRMGCMNMMGQGMGRGMMGGGMMMNMSTENQEKFLDATKEMRREMHNMRFDHMEAMRNPKTTLKDLAAMEQKMLDLRKKMMNTAEKYQDQKK